MMKCPFCLKRCRRLRPTEPLYDEETYNGVDAGWTCDRHTNVIIIRVAETKVYVRSTGTTPGVQGVTRYVGSICVHWTNKKGQPFVAYFNNAYDESFELVVYRIDPTRKESSHIEVLELVPCPKEITADNIATKVENLAIFA